MVDKMKNQSSYQPAGLMRKLNNSEYELRNHFEKNNIKVEIKKIEKMKTKESDTTMLKAKPTASKLCVSSVSAQQFQCYICALEFKLQDTLTLHLDKVHSILEEKVEAKFMKEVSSSKYFTPLTSSKAKAPTFTTSKQPPISTLQSKTYLTSSPKAAKEIASIGTDSSSADFSNKDELSDYKPDSDLDMDGGGFSDSDLDWINPKAEPVDDLKYDLKYYIKSELMDEQVDLDDDYKSFKLISKLKSKADKTQLLRNGRKRPNRRYKKRSHKCTHCDGIFHGNTEYLIHLSETHGLKKKPFHCDLCPSK